MLKRDFEWDEQLGWKENLLYFKNKRLTEVLQELGRWYGATFHWQGKPDSIKLITGKYRQPTLNEVLHSLSVAYEFDYEINGNQVVIKKFNHTL